MNDAEDIKALLTEIRNEQRMHHEEWKRAQVESQQLRLQAEKNRKAARRQALMLTIFIVILVGGYILMPVLRAILAFISGGTLHVHTQ